MDASGSGDGNDSFHQFTHRVGSGEQLLFDRLGVLLKNPCSRYVVGNRFLWLRREQERRQKWKDEVPASGHDKERFFRKWAQISGLGVYSSLCELVEGIVTALLFMCAVRRAGDLVLRLP
jgi:hypothetical protein